MGFILFYFIIFLYLVILAGLITLLLLFIFWLHDVVCGILVPWPGIEPAPPALEARSRNHWTAGEVPVGFIIK